MSYDAAATASANCPICGDDAPHGHSESTIEKWLSNSVARWGYRARVYPILSDDAPPKIECNCCQSRNIISRGYFEWCRGCGAIRIERGPWEAPVGPDPEKSAIATFYETERREKGL